MPRSATRSDATRSLAPPGAINPRIFASGARASRLLIGHGPSIVAPDPDEAALVPGPLGRLSSRKCVALAASLPGRAHLLPRHRHRSGRAISRQALGHQPLGLLRGRQHAARRRRGTRGGLVRGPRVLAPHRSHTAGHPRRFRPDELVGDPRAPVGRLHRVPLPLLRHARVPGALPGLDPLPPGGGLRRGPPRRRRRALAPGGLQPRGRDQFAVDLGRHPCAVRTVVVRGQRHRLAVQRARLRADRAHPRSRRRRHLRCRHRPADRLHQSGRRGHPGDRRASGHRQADRPDRVPPRHRRHPPARRELADPRAARRTAGPIRRAIRSSAAGTAPTCRSTT